MSWLGDHLWAVWLVAAMVLGVAELVSLDLVLIMLGVGALAGAVTAALSGPAALQAVVAALAAVGMLAFVRPPVVQRLHGGPELTLGHAKLVGRQGLVTAEITPNATGRVTLAGETWSASPYDPSTRIAVGETVEVFEIRGATAFVHPVPTLEQ
jgi:membrane protein implicated in regulation of membrane protease activity